MAPSRYRIIALAFATLCVAVAAACSRNDTSTASYQGKTVHMVIGYDPGGGYDTFARLVARYLAKHIPGNPVVVVQNMPGASSMTAANYIYGIGPQDGTMIGATGLAPVMQPLLDPKGASLDPRKLEWLPSSGKGLSVLFVWRNTGVTSIEDARKTPLTLAGNSAIGQTTLFTHVINETLGTKFKMIFGFESTPAEMLAMEHGEVQGLPGLMWSSLKSIHPDWLADNRIAILLQYGGDKPAPDLASAPFARDLIQNAGDKLLFDTAMAPLEVVRPFFMGPGVSADRLAVMRQAFTDTYNDPAFRADAAKLQIDIDPESGDAVQAMIERMYNAPPSIADRLRQLYRAPEE